MPLALDLLPVLAAARAIPGQLGLRPHTVAVVDTRWHGANSGEGHDSVYETPITEAGGHPPKVRLLTSEELAVAGLQGSFIEIGPITPAHNGGGTALDVLMGRLRDQGDIHQVRITGPMHPDGALYRVIESRLDHAMHYLLRAKPATSA